MSAPPGTVEIDVALAPLGGCEGPGSAGLSRAQRVEIFQGFTMAGPIRPEANTGHAGPQPHTDALESDPGLLLG